VCACWDQAASRRSPNNACSRGTPPLPPAVAAPWNPLYFWVSKDTSAFHWDNGEKGRRGCHLNFVHTWCTAVNARQEFFARRCKAGPRAHTTTKVGFHPFRRAAISLCPRRPHEFNASRLQTQNMAGFGRSTLPRSHAKP
jgi:hypothetical protein